MSNQCSAISDEMRQANDMMTQAERRHRSPAGNPKGIVSSSPGLRGTSYPGALRRGKFNPIGVVSCRDLAATPSGLSSTGPFSQGSSDLATLGWVPESPWDSARFATTGREAGPSPTHESAVVRSPLTRPSGTLSPPRRRGEGRGEGCIPFRFNGTSREPWQLVESLPARASRNEGEKRGQSRAAPPLADIRSRACESAATWPAGAFVSPPPSTDWILITEH
jgi:hypothetical protein